MRSIATMSNRQIGDLLRSWRTRRSFSQLELATNVGVSTRHLSFVETGRSNPSPELVLALAAFLDVPLRDRNTMLMAAGYAPRFCAETLDADAMAAARSAVERVLATHDPFPGLVLDRHWNIVMANRSAKAMLELLPERLRTEPLNLFRISLHPQGLAAFTTNLGVWGPHLRNQLDRLVAQLGDVELKNLDDEIAAYGNFDEGVLAGDDGVSGPVLTCNLKVFGQELSLFTTLTTFGAPRDATLDELLVELFFPADTSTELALSALASDTD